MATSKYFPHITRLLVQVCLLHPSEAEDVIANYRAGTECQLPVVKQLSGTRAIVHYCINRRSNLSKVLGMGFLNLMVYRNQAIKQLSIYCH